MLWRCPRCSCLNDPVLLTCPACGEPNRRHRKYRWEWALLSVLLLLVAAGPALWQAVSEWVRPAPPVAPLPDLGPQLPNLNGPEIPPLSDLVPAPKPLRLPPPPANTPPAPSQDPATGQLEVIWFMGGGNAALGSLINHSAHPVTVRLLARTITADERSGFRLNSTEVEVPARWGEHLDRTTTTIAPDQYDSFALQGVSVRTIPSGIVIRDAEGRELPYAEKPPAH